MSIYIRGDFHVCPNPISFDPYTVCELNCSYCFVKQMEKTYLFPVAKEGLKPRYLDSGDLNKKEAKISISNDIPITIGRKCEPFCKAEKTYRATENAVKILNDNGFKIAIETKGIPDDCCIKTLSKGDVYFMLTITAGDDYLCRRLEPEASLYSERWELARELKSLGFWVSLKFEPFIHGVNDGFEQLDDYVNKAKDIGVDFVTFGDFRVQDVWLAYKNLKERGFDLKKILEAKRTTWIERASYFKNKLRKEGLKSSSTDWTNFGFTNSSVSCCGLPFFHKFNFQNALKIILERGRVSFSDLEKENLFGRKERDKFKAIWNDESGKYFNLNDVKGIIKVGFDEEGNKVYELKRGGV